MWLIYVSSRSLLGSLLCILCFQTSLSLRRPWGLIVKAPFYHSSDALHSKLAALASNCSGASLVFESVQHGAKGWKGHAHDAVKLDVVTVSARTNRSSSTVPLRAFFLFGEHARELVTAESGLNLVETLCGMSGDATQQHAAQQVLAVADIKIVVNANPIGRRVVEAGQFCHRANGRGVDLNRNWDDHFTKEASAADANPGPSPFSESETRSLRDIVAAWKPNLFLAVHSGSKLLAYPHGYASSETATGGSQAAWQLQHFQISRRIASKYCPSCTVASLGKSDLGYAPPGTSMDYAFDKLHARFSFTWEIFDGEALDENVLLEQPLYYTNDNVTQVGGRQSVRRKPALITTTLEPGRCFSMFNPTSEELLADTLHTWSWAYLDLVRATANSTKRRS